MRLLPLLPQAVLLLGALQTGVSAAGWSFTDGLVSVQSKGAGVGGGLKEKSAYSFELAYYYQIHRTDVSIPD